MSIPFWKLKHLLSFWCFRCHSSLWKNVSASQAVDISSVISFLEWTLFSWIHKICKTHAETQVSICASFCHSLIRHRCSCANCWCPTPSISWAVSHKLRLISWMNICSKDRCSDFRCWHSIALDRNKQLIPAVRYGRETKEQRQWGKFSHHLSSVLAPAPWWEAKEHGAPLFLTIFLFMGI